MTRFYLFQRLSLLTAGLLLLAATGCRFGGEGLSWDSDLSTPIAYAKLGLRDAVRDSNAVMVGSDQLLSLVYRDTLAVAELIDDQVVIPDSILKLSVKLESITLDPGAIVQTITLGQIARTLQAQRNPLGDVIIAAHGSMLPLPDINNLTSGNIPVDASAFFQYANIRSGQLRLRIENELPSDLKNVRFFIQNNSGPPPVILDTFPLIPSRSSITELYDIAGRTIQNQLTANLANMDVAATPGFVLIDTSDFIRITLETLNLTVNDATAIFPAQTVLDSIGYLDYRFGGEFADVEITKLKVSSGKLRVRSISTIGDTVRFAYSLPSASRNGQIPSVSLKIRPGSASQPSVQEQVSPLDGFTIDMTRGGRGFNRVEQRLVVDLLYSGRTVTLDRNDSIGVDFGLVDVKPVYIEGYIGRQAFRFSGTEALRVFEDLNIGTLNLLNPIGRIQIANGIGADHLLTLHKLEARNRKSGQQVRLVGDGNRAGPVQVPGPVLGDTFGTAFTTLNFNGINGNLNDFVNIQPDEINYDIEIQGNYNGRPGQHRNFASNRSKISAYVELEMPLDGVVEHLRLSDTVALTPGSLSGANIERLQDGALTLLLDNGFPFEVQVTAKVYDSDFRLITVLADAQTIQAGVVLPATGRVETPLRSAISKQFDAELLRRVLEDGRHLTLSFDLNTRPQGRPVKIYSDYTVTARLSGNFMYRNQL